MRLRDRVTFPRFAAFTTGLTLTLVMLGVYTAATGSGLACSAQWPLCDNGLLPQTIPSFIEWFHRLVAMITGWFIVGTAVWSWRRETDTRLAATLAVLLLPLQISIGAVTVTLNGLLPRGYSAPTQGAHLVVALTIFSLLVWTTLTAREESEGSAASGATSPLPRVRRTLLVALAALVGSALASRVFTPTPYGPGGQAVFYGLSLVAVAALLAATRWLATAEMSWLRLATGTVLGLLFVGMLLGRDLVFYTSTVRLLNAAVFLIAGVLVAAVTVLVGRARPEDRAGPTVSSD